MASHESELEKIRRAYTEYGNNPRFAEKWGQTNPGNAYAISERKGAIKALLSRFGYFPLETKKVLDLGCGLGHMLQTFRSWGVPSAQLFGIDLMNERIAAAKHLHPEFNFVCGDASQTNFPDASFDIIVVSTLFSSIPDRSLALKIASEVNRVLAPGGVVIWYDFRYNSPKNPNVRGIQVREIQGLFPDFNLHWQLITLLPPLARRLGRFTNALYSALAKIPMLRTHFLALLIKPK